MFMHRITLKNILSFGPDTRELKLKPLNVLIGPNGSGKSNLIEAIGLLQAAPGDLQKPIREGGGVGNWIWKGKPGETFAEIIVVISSSGNRLLRYRLTFHEDKQRFRLHGESLCPESLDAGPVPINYFDADADNVHLLVDDSRQETGRSTVKEQPGASDQSVFASIKGPTYPELTHTGEQFQRIGLFREWAFGRRTRLRLPQTADLPNDFLMEGGNNLGLVLNRIKRDYPTEKDQLLHALRQLYENIVDFDVSIEGGAVQVFLREGGITVPATRLSDGALRYLCLLAVLCHPKPPPLICIEVTVRSCRYFGPEIPARPNGYARRAENGGAPAPTRGRIWQGPALLRNPQADRPRQGYGRLTSCQTPDQNPAAKGGGIGR